MSNNNDYSRTKELFSTLIKRPQLTLQLLQRPPFKFIHDIVRETLQATPGFLEGILEEDELDPTKASSTRDSKISFLQRVIDALNTDGSLNSVRPAKIVAGKEPELTNILLQKLAIEAEIYSSKKLKNNAPKKSKSSTSNKNERIKTNNTENYFNNNSETEQHYRRTDKKLSEKSDKNATKKRSKSRDQSAIKEKKSANADKLEKKKKTKAHTNIGTDFDMKESKNVEKGNEAYLSQHFANREVDSNYTPQILQNETDRAHTERESSGGTSKGADDSGIAEETSAESGRHDSGEFRKPVNSDENNRGMKATDLVSVLPIDNVTINEHAALTYGTSEDKQLHRPQTAIGRPGTAVAKPAPPRLKKNLLPQSTEPNLQQKSRTDTTELNLLIVENNKTQNDVDQFFVEENEEMVGSTMGTSISKLREGEEHGVLVNKIIENTREQLEQEQLTMGEKDHITTTYDFHEQNRMRNEIESIKCAIQKTMQNIQPLARTLQSASYDFDAALKEVQDSRANAGLSRRELDERNSVINTQTDTMIFHLRNLDAEISDIRTQLALTTARILKNESKIDSLLSNL